MKHLKRIEIMAFVILIPFLLSLLTGCMSSVRKNYFQLSLPVEVKGMPGKKPGPLIERTVLIQPVKMEEIYNDYRLIYRSSPYKLDYYSYNYWVKRPDYVIKDAISDYLVKRGWFTRVFEDLSEGDPQWLLKSTVQVMEEYDTPQYWTAHLKMKIEIRSFKTNEVVGFHSFDRTVPLPRKKVEDLPEGLSKIMKEELEKMLIKLMDLDSEIQHQL